MAFRSKLISICLLAAATVAFSACSDETDEDVAVEADAGTDTDYKAPSVDSVDFEGAQPSEPQRIHVESSQKRGVISDDPPLGADEFFTEEQAQRLIPGTDLETHTIVGQDVSPTQNSIRYTPAGAAKDIFGASLQVWDLDGADLTAGQRRAELREQFLNVEDDLEDAPRDAFLSRRSGIQSLIFTAEEGPYVFVLSCDVDHCERDELIEMASNIAGEH